MKKKILSIALALALILAFAPAAAADDTLTFTIGEGLSFTVTNAVLSDETIPLGWGGEWEEYPVYYVLDGLSLLTIIVGYQPDEVDLDEGLYGQMFFSGIGGYEVMIDEETGVEYFRTLSPPLILYASDFVPYYYEDMIGMDGLLIDEMLLTRSIPEMYEPYNHDSFIYVAGYVFKVVGELPDDPVTLTPEMPGVLFDGADDWAMAELEGALANGLILDFMIENWTQPTNRLDAAEAIAKLTEAITGKSIEEIAAEMDFDMTDTFDDTESEYATFLKASGISVGMGGGVFGTDGIFTRIQMVVMLGRMAENVLGADLTGAPTGSEMFSDIPDWPGADMYVGWAHQTGITLGQGGGLFGSEDALQNQHTAMFANRALNHFRPPAGE